MSKRKIAATPQPSSAAYRLFDTPVIQCLLIDHISPDMTIRDVDPFGSYYLTPEGDAAFIQAIRSGTPMMPFETAAKLEAKVLRFFIAVAQHARRYVVLTKDHLHTFGNYPLGSSSGQSNLSFHAPGLNIEDSIEVAGMPAETVVRVSGYPEDFGWLCWQPNTNLYGVHISNTQHLCVLRVVPKPFGYGDKIVERIPLP